MLFLIRERDGWVRDFSHVDSIFAASLYTKEEVEERQSENTCEVIPLENLATWAPIELSQCKMVSRTAKPS